MKVYYLNTIKESCNLPPDLEFRMISSPVATEESKKAIQFFGKRYELLDTLPDKNSVVVGYIHADKEEKERKWNQEKTLVIDELRIPANLYEKPLWRKVGYLGTEKENEFIEVTRPLILLPFWLFPLLGAFFIAILILIIMLFSPLEMETPVFGNDPVMQGGITADKIEPLDPVYFNLKINATPILKNGKMNLRIENSSRNIYSCHVEVKADKKGEQVIIYSSPLIEPDQSIEYATVSELLASGTHDAIAVFSYYEHGKPLEVKTTVRLIINVPEQTVEVP